MTAYVLDTHACVFALSEPRKLGGKARAALTRVESGRGAVWIPAAVLAEIVLLKELGRSDLGLPELAAVFRETPSFRFAALDLAQLDQFAALGAIRDPFDRLIVAAARELDAKLITKDASLAASGLVEVVWS